MFGTNSLVSSMKYAFAAATFAFSLCVSVWAASASAQEEVTIRFGAVTAGPPPAAFVPALTGGGMPVRWEVVADESVPSGRAVAEVSADRTDYRFPLLIYQPVVAKDIDVRVRFSAISGRIDQAAGLAARLTDADNYYVVRANALENNVRLYRVVEGQRRQIEGSDLPVSARDWHSLGLRISGERITASFDGRELFTVTDRTISEAGRVALWTKADSVTHFDEFAIRTLK